MTKTLPNQTPHFFTSKYYFLLLIILTSFKSSATIYYVNDADAKGDVFTLAIGNDANDGLSKQSPKLTIKAAYALAKEGDAIYIDTGSYTDFDTNGNLAFQNTKKIQIISAKNQQDLLTKTPLPTVDKSTPEDFYIVNDKPVSREVYMRYLQLKSKKE